MVMNYVLTKLSYPGFELTTQQEQHVIDMLYNYICDSCMDDIDSTDTDLLGRMLGTSCGAEFFLNINSVTGDDSEEHY